MSGQALDFTHQFWVRTGSTSQDFVRGVDLWFDDSAVYAADTREPGPPAQRRALIEFRSPSGTLDASYLCHGGSPGNEAWPWAVAMVHPEVVWCETGVVSPPPRAVATGAFLGTVQYPSGTGPTLTNTSGAPNTLVVKFDRQQQNALWAVHFSGPQANEGLAIASGPQCGLCGTGSGGGPVCTLGTAFIAVGGYFKGTATFSPSIQRTSAGGEDAYVALLYSNPGVTTVISVLAFGSASGDERVTGVAVDDADQSVVVTGFFSSVAVDFDPNRGTPFFAQTHSGGRDIFVAKYRPDQNGQLLLAWLYTTGTAGTDEGSALAVAVPGNAYATGWKADYCSRPDLWAIRLPADVESAEPFHATPQWQHTWPGNDGDERGLGVTTDQLGRAVITGSFMGDTCGSFANSPLSPQYCFDFNPASGVDNRCVNGGKDLFVTRLSPAGIYDGTYTFGGPYDDEGTGVAVEWRTLGRIAHAGSFAGGGPGGSAVDLDPGPGTYNLATAGDADAFLNVLDPALPQAGQIVCQLSLILDNSASVVDADWQKLMSDLGTLLTNPLVVPQDGTVAMNAVLYSAGAFANLAVQMIPWTVMDSVKAPQFAARLAGITRPSASGTLNEMSGGVRVAASRVEIAGFAGDYASGLVIGDEVNSAGPGDLLAARAFAVTASRFDQINGIAVREGSMYDPSRTYCLDYLVQSIVQISSQQWPGVPENERNLGYAAQTPTLNGYFDAQFDDLVRHMLMHATRCPGDYNRNGVVNLADRNLLLSHSVTPGAPCTFGNQYYPYWCGFADWNFDGLYQGANQNPPYTDRAKFFTAQDSVVCP